ncbi:MAG: cytidine deaminase [Wenzhouxiangellaceae bacterium]|nr:cytidine deaminase [Wenzhouxiangellaceae bacterium]
MKTLDPDILATLIASRNQAYAPYSGFMVSALVESVDGRHFAGTNVETAHYKSICAEASAISAMVCAGRRRIAAVYILAGNRPTPPCGDCRQRILEFAEPDTRIVLIDPDGRIAKSYSIDELLPDAFGPNNLAG